jgi:hypothetical protein
VLATLGRHCAAVLGRPVDLAVRTVRAGSGGFVALIFHRVGRRSPSPVDLPYDVFTEVLDRLAETGRVADLNTAVTDVDHRSDDDNLLPRVVLTFDDGTADWADVVLPELVARRLPGTFYVATEYVELGRRFPDEGVAVSWSGLEEMVASGLVEIGSHTHSHRVLARVGATEATQEIDRSIGLIEERLGVPCRHFAYPNAVAGSSAADVVVRRRFASAALAGNRVNRQGADRYQLGRHGLTCFDDPPTLERKMNGGAWLEGWLRERRGAFGA